MEDHIAQTIAICLEDIENDGCSIEDVLDRYPEIRSELEPYLRIAMQIKEAPEVHPGPDFIRNSRARLTKALRAHNANASFPDQFLHIMKVRDWLGRRPIMAMARMAIVLLLVVLSGTVTAQAARHATPGTVLYPVKIGMEKAQLVLANQQKSVELQVQFARNRNEEIIRLQEMDRYEDIHIAQEQFEKYIHQVTEELIIDWPAIEENENQELMNEVDEALQNHVEVLQNVLEYVPEEAKPAIEHALDESTKELDRIKGNKNVNDPKKDQSDKREKSSEESVNHPTITPTPQDQQGSNQIGPLDADQSTTPQDDEKNNAKPPKPNPRKP